MAKVRACLHVGHGDEADARILETLAHSVAENLADRLIDPAHSVGAHIISSNAAIVRSTRTPWGRRASRKRSTRSAACSTAPCEPPTRAAARVARCQRS